MTFQEYMEKTFTPLRAKQIELEMKREDRRINKLINKLKFEKGKKLRIKLP